MQRPDQFIDRLVKLKKKLVCANGADSKKIKKIKQDIKIIKYILHLESKIEDLEVNLSNTEEYYESYHR